ncbi:hypothetical protein A2567_01280 [Candidatus Azambacteria bacterium RIFOXYD1_FULL_42_11]|uniref:ThiF family protein n=3 Tax=Candidatus Azamiibacteriota TaxID=1752741 RepID=A0A0G0ZAS6_9BACT|nr:MAG: ThiF family protein [Candidatus Azambacteria bacterium GW2011_GWB1_42_17]KKS45815.1 MAG: ThiF family protein [Candidatus Azambacteria bacterium GW2011_GWA1_42_19]OGD42991.1 MAG: hypothetical protein A2567_01280 [Candidatus Azambacteria bacterium RIFOXYD1_FULL_42_11]
MKKATRLIECFDLPDNPDLNAAYRLLPKNPDENYYRERVDRNIGWITKEEQEALRKITIGIAGCGGMGGLLGQIFVRLGIGEVRIADCESFDVSNINRQFAATRITVGKSKAIETAKKIRETTDDTTLLVYPGGICEESVSGFLNGCDVVCDEIEFWAVAARILFHQAARNKKITILCADTVGHRTFLFKFTHDSMRVEDSLGLTYKEAKILQKKLQNKKASPEERWRILKAVNGTFAPELPEYFIDVGHGTVKALEKRLFEEGRASIISTNPIMAGGFLANHVLLYLLGEKISPGKRNTVNIPKTPGYLSFDAGHMKAVIVPENQNRAGK